MPISTVISAAIAGECVTRSEDRAPIRASAPPARLVILGHPVAQSLSPRFQNAALAHAGLPQRYDAIDVPPERLSVVMQQLTREHAGGNVTMPLKQRVYELAARTTTLARRVGAVNTFWHESGELVGHNTDVVGVLASLKALLADRRGATRCLILGAGGAAAAALVALELHGVSEIRIWSRSPHRAEHLVTSTGVAASVVESLDDAQDGGDAPASLLINATPIGMDGVTMPVTPARLANDCVICDLVYRADGTPLVRAARDRGLRAEDGRRMLIEQGAESFRVWFDREPPIVAMWDAIGVRPPEPSPPSLQAPVDA